MKKFSIIFLTGLTFFSLQALAGEKRIGIGIIPADSTKKGLTDPVCGMKVKQNQSKNILLNKITYYFCSENCKQKFISEPVKYIKK